MAGMLDRLFGGFRRRVGPTQRAGEPGFRVVGGYLDEEERNSKLRGENRYRTYSDLLANVSIVGAGVRYFLNLVSRSKWKFEPAEGDTSGEFAEKAEKILTEDPLTPWHRIVRRSAMYRFYGFSFQEWTMRRDDEEGYVTFDDIEPRPQKTIERWDIDDTGAVAGVVQRSVNTLQELYLPRAKLVYLVDDTLSDSPEGLGIFRHLVAPGIQIQRLEQLEGFGFETDLRGMPIGRGPFEELRKQVENGEITDAQREQIEKVLRDFIVAHIKTPNQGLLLDSMTYQTQDERGTPSPVPKWNLELLTGHNTTQDAIAKAIERKNWEIARLLGAEGLMVGQQRVGTQALSRDKTQNLWLMVDGALQEIAEAYDIDLLDVVFSVNGWDPKLKPKMTHESVQFKDVEQITAALRDMATAGAVLAPEDPVIEEVRGLLGLTSPVVIPEVVDPDLALGGSDPNNPDDPDDPDKPGKPGKPGSEDPDELPERGGRRTEGE